MTEQDLRDQKFREYLQANAEWLSKMAQRELTPELIEEMVQNARKSRTLNGLEKPKGKD